MSTQLTHIGPSSGNPGARIKGFDGLRAISILMVMFTHLNVWEALSVNSEIARFLLLFSGGTGVYIFFALSGFLITLLLLKEKERTGTVNVRNFYFRRALRLLPAITVFFMVIAIMMYMGWLSPAWKSLLIAALYLYNFVPARYYTSELGHTWSLGVEEQFYLLWPLVVRRIKAPLLPLLLGLLMFFCLIIPLVISGFSFTWNGKTHDFVRFFWDLQRFFVPAIAPVIMGAYVAWLYLYAEVTWSRWLCMWAVVLFSVQLYLPDVVFYYFPAHLFKGAGAALALLYLATHQEGKLAKLLEWRPLAWLGSISYGIYVWQGLFLRTGPGGKLWIQHFPENIILTILAAVLSYYLMERYFLHWKKKFSA